MQMLSLLDAKLRAELALKVRWGQDIRIVVLRAEGSMFCAACRVRTDLVLSSKFAPRWVSTKAGGDPKHFFDALAVPEREDRKVGSQAQCCWVWPPIHTYSHTYIHTYIRTHIHTYPANNSSLNNAIFTNWEHSTSPFVRSFQISTSEAAMGFMKFLFWFQSLPQFTVGLAQAPDLVIWQSLQSGLLFLCFSSPGNHSCWLWTALEFAVLLILSLIFLCFANFSACENFVSFPGLCYGHRHCLTLCLQCTKSKELQTTASLKQATTCCPFAVMYSWGC